MTNLVNPLQQIVKRAAAVLPVETGRVACEQARIDRRRGAVVLLVDVSHSMSELAGGVRRKIDVVREAVSAVQAQNSAFRLIAFSDAAKEVTVVPDPEGGTDLVRGLQCAQQYDPGVTLLISDGQPVNPAAALRVARAWRGVIDVLYVGPESDVAAIKFMRDMATAAGGNTHVNDLHRNASVLALTQTIAGLLP